MRICVIEYIGECKRHIEGQPQGKAFPSFAKKKEKEMLNCPFLACFLLFWQRGENSAPKERFEAAIN
jgi:hypothetical protein